MIKLHKPNNNQLNTKERQLLIGLVFLSIAAIYYYSMRILLVLATSVLVSVFADFLCVMARKQKYYLHDTSAVYSGLALGLLMPEGIPLYIAGTAAFISITVGKQCFGGRGSSVFNPIAVGYVFALVTYKTQMLSFGAGSVSVYKSLSMGVLPAISLKDAFIGSSVGAVGTTSILITVIMGVAFSVGKIISGKMIFTFTALYFVLSAVFPLASDYPIRGALYELCSGAVLFTVVFIANYPSHCPCRSKALYGAVLAVTAIIFSRISDMENTVLFAVLVSDILTDSVENAARRIYKRIHSYMSVEYDPKGSV